MNHRFELYQTIQQRRPAIMQRIAQIPDEIGMPEKYKNGKLGMLGGSGLHASPRRDVLDTIRKGSEALVDAQSVNSKLRKLVKDQYGDEWDAVAVSTGEAAMHLAADVLLTPPMAGRGDGYRSRYIVPYERHLHHHAGYGAPFPPRYKDMYAERGVTSGELGMLAKRLWNLDVVLVKLPGAKYQSHGIRQFVCPLLHDVDPEAAATAIARAADIHASSLSGFASMGYDNPGYGYRVREDGAPVLQKRIGAIAREHGVPYIVDNARGTPFLGTDPRTIDADLVFYSTDKAFVGPTGGLIIGREDVMVQIRRAMGMHGMRFGTVESHGKAGYVAFDPGKEAMLGIVRALELLVEDPKSFTQPVDQTYEIAQREFREALPADVFEHVRISKSYNALNVEVDYTGTWDDGRWGIPIFSIEDMYAGSNLVQAALPAMGMLPGMLAYDGNIVLAPNMGTADPEGRLDEEAMTFAIRCVARSLAVIHDEAYRVG